MGMRNRRIVDGADTVRIFGEAVAVAVRAWTVNGFSSHADQPIPLDWIRRAEPERLILGTARTTRSTRGLSRTYRSMPTSRRSK